jgi:hypothetical protein
VEKPATDTEDREAATPSNRSVRPVVEHALTAYGYSPDTARTLIDRLIAEQGGH